jgi:hypothetical protein
VPAASLFASTGLFASNICSPLATSLWEPKGLHLPYGWVLSRDNSCSDWSGSSSFGLPFGSTLTSPSSFVISSLHIRPCAGYLV